MLLCREAACIPLQDPLCLPTLVVFWFRDKLACKRLGGCTFSSGKAPGACPMACSGDDVGCVVGEAGAGSIEGDVADERPDGGNNRAVGAVADDSVVVSGVLTEGEDGC